MEVAMMMHSSQNHQHISPYKSHVGNPKRMMSMNMMNPPFISRPNENLFPSANIHKGLLQTPNIFHSLPQYFSPPFHAPYGGNTNGNASYNNPALARGLSCPPPISKKPSNSSNNNNNKKSRDYSITPRKTKKVASSNSPKKEEKLKNTTRVVATKASSPPSSSEGVVMSSKDSSGPDPKDLAKDVSKVVLSLSTTPQLSSSLSLLSSKSSSSSVGKISVFSSSIKGIEGEQNHHQMDRFSGSVMFTPSPPPSSLPLPTFSLRPKLSCNAEAAAGIDAGATDSLRRLLRLQ